MKSYGTNVMNFNNTRMRWRSEVDETDAALVIGAALTVIGLIDRITAMLARYGDAKEGMKELVADLREIIRRCKDVLGR